MPLQPPCEIHGNIGREAGVSETCYPLRGNLPEATRRGRVLTIDTSLRQAEFALSEIDIPFEATRPGPSGRLFQVDASDYATMLARCRARLDQPGRRYDFDEGDPESHCRNAYFVAMETYESFRRALGRPVAWSFWKERSYPPLRLRPFGFDGLDAYYEPGGQAIFFGFGRAGAQSPRGDRDLLRFTALSSDVVAHEVTHALIDGLRPGYDFPFNPDVFAFHEALADLVALLSRFGRQAYFRHLLAAKDFLRDGGLLDLAPAIGEMVRRSGLRTLDVDWTTPARAAGPEGTPLYREAPEEPHARGGLLSSAVFEAFMRAVARRILPLIRLAADRATAERALIDQVERIVTRAARHFLTICVRALDYCPPAAILFPDYLRALITADRILVPNDRYGYREELIDAFRRRGIYPADIDVVSEAELTWNAPEMPIYPLPGLAIGELRYQTTPTLPLSPEEIRRQARALALAIDADRRLFHELGLRAGAGLSAPVITSIRPTVRIGPDGYLDASVIAEITQERIVAIDGAKLHHRGGAVLVISASGKPSHVIRQRIDNEERLAAEMDHVGGLIRSRRLRAVGESYAMEPGYRLCSAH